jgi:putative oxidoreductase
VIQVDIAAVVLRAIAGVVMLAHGYNHVFRGGRLAGTGRWFESIGIKPGWLHARLASYTELGSGVLLLLGLATPLAAAGAVGTMAVALVANHLKNGFFIFRPGEGYEYVLTLLCVGLAVGALGGGRLSLDHAVGLHWDGWGGLAAAAGAGLGGAAVLLAGFWRPAPPKP